MIICSIGLFLTDFLQLFYPYFLLMTLTMTFTNESNPALSYVVLFLTTFFINYSSS